MVDFINERNVAKITAESIEPITFNIFATKTTARDLSAFSTVVFEYFINGSSKKFTIPVTITNAPTGLVTVLATTSTNWPKFQGGQTRKKGNGKFVFDNTLSTEFSTPPFPVEILRPA